MLKDSNKTALQINKTGENMHSRARHNIAAWVKASVLCSLIAALGAVAVSAQSQITSGVVQGTVSDANGAVVPGASVEVTNLETSLVKTVSTDEEGRFSFLQLPSSRYSLTVSKQGFAKLEQKEFPLTVGQTVSLNLTLPVASLENIVTITSIPTVDTVKTESSTTINETSVSNLPVLGRKFEDLLTLTPNVSV